MCQGGRQRPCETVRAICFFYNEIRHTHRSLFLVRTTSTCVLPLPSLAQSQTAVGYIPQLASLTFSPTLATNSLASIPTSVPARPSVFVLSFGYSCPAPPPFPPTLPAYSRTERALEPDRFRNVGVVGLVGEDGPASWL